MTPDREQARIGRTAILLAIGVALGGPAAADVVLNELMTSNGSTLVDENGDSPDWLELYNAGQATEDLTGWGLSDDSDRPFKWRLSSAALGPGEFLLIYASGKDRQPQITEATAPAGVPGLVCWLRADAVQPDDPAQVRRAGNSVLVRRWRNLAGTGSDARQETSASQPLWVAAGANGRPALRFDGVNDRLELPSAPGTNSFCLFAVFRTSRPHENDPESRGGVGGTAGQRYLFGARHGGDLGAGAGLSVGTNGIAVYEHGSGYMPAVAVWSGPLASAVSLVAVNYDHRRPTLEVQGLIARVGGDSPRNTVTAPTEIGAGAYGAFAGDLFEVIIYDRALDEAQRRGITRSLADRYALTLPEPRHTNFQLDADGEELRLTRADGQLLDRIAFEAIPRDVSYGRQPDGAPAWLLFAEPTPSAPNLTPGSVEWVEAPVFSHDGGFYTEAVPLRLTSPTMGAEVRYTLDGSEPTELSLRHVPPLLLGSRAGTANDLSRIPTVPGGLPPQGAVFKGWVVRARSYKPGALPSRTVTRSYWITPAGRARYTLPVISLATARAALFDPAVGIYVPGNAPGGNYSQRGPEWERPVHLEFHETDGSLALAQDADIKIHGNTSQGFPIKGLDLDGTGGRGRQPFRHRIFPDRARVEFEHFLLRPTGHDQPTAFMRDELMQSLAAETGAETQAARACVVFINGEYWGLHYLKEKEDAEFVSYYGDLPPDGLDYLEGYAAAKAGDTQHYQEMIAFLAANDLAAPDAYEHVRSLMDVPNYLDYKICEVFFYRWDIGNHRLWRPRSPEGRWRWLQFDNDVGWGGFWAEQPAWQFNMLAAVLTPNGSLHGHNNETTTFLLRRLLVNAEAQRDFINRFADLLNSTFAPSHTLTRINALADVLAPEMAEHTRRWRSPGSLAEWQQHVQYLRTFATRRPEFARQHLRQRFGLRGTAIVTLSVSDPRAGRLRLNSLDLEASADAPWTGTYFLGLPIQLTALPAPGRRFSGWRGLPGVQTNAVTLILNGDLSLEAMFEPDEAMLPRLRVVRTPGANPFQLELTGPPRALCQLESAADLVNWHPVATLPLDGSGRAAWQPPSNGGTPTRFYRVAIP